jgi:RNA polymerase sigma-70 factor (ECF subfamily)
MQAVLAERSIILATLAGIPKRHCADVEQAVIIAAWSALKRSRYRPDPKDKPRDALRKLMHGVAWRQAAKYLDSAYERRLILDPQPLLAAPRRRWTELGGAARSARPASDA